MNLQNGLGPRVVGGFAGSIVVVGIEVVAEDVEDVADSRPNDLSRAILLRHRVLKLAILLVAQVLRHQLREQLGFNEREHGRIIRQ